MNAGSCCAFRASVYNHNQGNIHACSYSHLQNFSQFVPLQGCLWVMG